MRAGPSYDGLDRADRALVTFATTCATDPASIGEADVATLREHGLTDADVADVIFAVAARCFFATVLDAGGAQADAALATTFDDTTREGLTVGRPFAEG